MTPPLRTEAARDGKKNASAAKPYTRYSLPAAILVVAISGVFFAWRMTIVRNVPLPADVIAELRLHPIRPHPLAAAQTQIRAVLEQVRPRRTRLRSKSMKASLPTPAPVASAKVQVEIQHHFNTAKASIWLDDKLISDQNLRGGDQKHSLLRTVEINQVTTFQFPAGRHWLQIRVLSPSTNYDQIETLDVDLAPNSDRVLSVNCSKRKMLVVWE
jgi:hypothetical protein